jgi:hypothetical protein
MIRGALKFHRAVMKTSIPVRMWLMVLAGLNLIGPLFFIGRVEAQVVLVTFLLSAMLMMALTGKFGFTRILGVGHILWIPLVYYLWTKLAENPADQPFGLWLRAVVVVIGISLLIDAVDVVRYAAGDREEMVRG